jgi:hypothetical protein
MIRILAGDWKAGGFVVPGRAGRIPILVLNKTGGGTERIAITDITTAAVMTEENRTSIAKKLAWSFIGLETFGLIGAGIGMMKGGESKEQVVAIVFKDGRKLLITGKAKKLKSVFATATWDTMLAKVAAPGAPAQASLPAPQPLTPIPNPWRTWHKITLGILGALFVAICTIGIWGPYVATKHTPTTPAKVTATVAPPVVKPVAQQKH